MLVSIGLMLVASCVPPAPAPAPPSAAAQAEPRHPVIIVHGFQIFCGSESADVWQVWFDEAQRRGYRADEITMFDYDTCQPSVNVGAALANRIDEVLAATGAPKVDLIAHSMGSIISRSCIRSGGCAGKVGRFASIAGANHGTLWANFCPLAFWSPSCGDMLPEGPYLAGLNATDETWGDTGYRTMVSWCDLTIVPFTSTALDGALNVVTDRCVSHTEWRSDQIGATWVFDWFTGPAPSVLPG